MDTNGGFVVAMHLITNTWIKKFYVFYRDRNFSG
jgi:hypothetical protein